VFLHFLQEIIHVQLDEEGEIQLFALLFASAFGGNERWMEVKESFV
jgi:hypothetical protein